MVPSTGSTRTANIRTSGSTRSSAGRRRTGAWTRPASRTCGRAAYDIDARVADMDINGVWASLCFPSLVAGFCGSVFMRSDDPELGLACLRAWNDWHLEVWAGTYPERIIPLQLPWLADVDVAAEDVRANAERGFKAVSFPEFPAQLGLPAIFTDHWDPFFAACEETWTVVCLHTGASAWAPLPSPAPPFELLPTLFPVNALIAAAEWLWSGVPVRFPKLAHRHVGGGHRVGSRCSPTGSTTSSPTRPQASSRSTGRRTCCRARCSERNFWFCTIDDPSMVALRDVIGVDHIMVESDYPHADSTWPDTQRVLRRAFASLDEIELRMVAAGQCGPPVPPSAPSERRLEGRVTGIVSDRRFGSAVLTPID